MTGGKASKHAAEGAAKAAGGIFERFSKNLFRLKDGHHKIVRLDTSTISDKTRESWKARPSKRVAPNGPVNSKKLDLNKREEWSDGERELVDAVEKTRRELGDDTGGNYAAFRYIDDDGAERILVTSSAGVHSERWGGNFLLDAFNGDSSRIKSVYTERSPCNCNSSFCDEWMKKHIPNADVAHLVDYGTNGKSRGQGNYAHGKYVKSLFL